MNWEAVAAIGELVGAAAVVVTLVYLTLQLRQNTAAVSTSTFESVTSGFNAVNQSLVDDDELAGIFLRGTSDPDSLTDEEAVRYSFLMRCWANQWMKLYRLREAGALGKDVWAIYAAEAAEAFGTPGGKRFRDQNEAFSELWAEIDACDRRMQTSVRLGVMGPDPARAAEG